VYDAAGKSSGSNIVSATTLEDLSPDSVELKEPADVGAHSVYLSWDQSNEEDFASYKLYRAATAEVGNQGNPILVADTRDETYYEDTGLQSSTTYYYRVFVYDEAGQSSGSNVVSATTLDDVPPAPVSLVEPAEIGEHSLSLSWTQSGAEDFASYRLYRSESPDVGNQGSPILVTNTRDETYYEDTALKSSTIYYYRVFVYDAVGQSSGSNEVSASTLPNSPPDSVVLATPQALQAMALRLSWSRNWDTDFDSYRIYRSETANVDSTLTPIAIINNQTTTSFDDTQLESNTRYFYRVFVFDSEGLSSGSNEVEGTTLP
jgi:fibronectin type 3 domain-containing protein